MPNAVKGSNQALTDAEKSHLVETVLKDAEHCRMTFSQLAEAGKSLSLSLSLSLLFFFCLTKKLIYKLLKDLMYIKSQFKC